MRRAASTASPLWRAALVALAAATLLAAEIGAGAVAPAAGAQRGESAEVAGGTGQGGPSRAAARGGRILVAAQAKTASDRVRLADVAELSGGAARFADVDLGEAPAAGEQRRIAGTSILHALEDAGIEGSGVRYVIPPTVEVTRDYREVGAQEIRRELAPAIRAALHAAEDAELSLDVAQPLRLAPGPYELVLGARKNAGAGLTRIDVDALQNGERVGSTSVRVRVDALWPVVSTRRHVARGRVLEEADLVLEERRLPVVPEDLVGSLEDAIGKRARVGMPPGRPVRADALEALPLVKRGDVVRVLVDARGMRLTAQAEALETAGKGERVRVRNVTSGREVTGEVVAHGWVRVAY